MNRNMFVSPTVLRFSRNEDDVPSGMSIIDELHGDVCAAVFHPCLVDGHHIATFIRLSGAMPKSIDRPGVYHSSEVWHSPGM